MTIQVLNGANLGRLGKREPEKYGTTTYAELVQLIEAAAEELGVEVVVRQTDSEAELLGWVFDAADAGQLRVPIAKAFPLEQLAEAHRLVSGGHVRGKVVVTLR